MAHCPTAKPRERAIDHAMGMHDVECATRPCDISGIGASAPANATALVSLVAPSGPSRSHTYTAFFTTQSLALLSSATRVVHVRCCGCGSDP